MVVGPTWRAICGTLRGPDTHRKAAPRHLTAALSTASITTASRRDAFAVARGYVVGTGSFVAKRNNVARFRKRHTRGPVIAKVVDMLENKVINSHLRKGVLGVTAGGGGMRAGDGRANVRTKREHRNRGATA